MNGSIAIDIPWSLVTYIPILMGVPLKASFSVDSQSMDEDGSGNSSEKHENEAKCVSLSFRMKQK